MTFQTNTKRKFFTPCHTVGTSMAGLALLAALAGCSRGPAALPLPSYDPSGSAAKAMELYDTNGDGFVDEEELEKAPGLKAAMKNLDQNKDGKVSEEEVADRVRVWAGSKTGAMMFGAEVLMDGQPLADAVVTYDPDEIMLGAVQPAVDVTSMGGTISPKVPKEKRPTPDFPPGMQAGIYKVRVSKTVGGKETIPTKYNTETTLGQEVSKDDWAILNRKVVYKLKSK